MELTITDIHRSSTTNLHPSGKCPIDHRAYSQQKAALRPEPAGLPAVGCDNDGVWHIRGFEEARAVLRIEETRQAGFKAELIDQMSLKMTPPVLYQDGEAHLEQRKLIARFFTPKTTSRNYRQMMEQFSNQLIDQLTASKQADLSLMSMKLAVQVASQVVGLTNSLLPGMDRRLNSFFSGGDLELKWTPSSLFSFVRRNFNLLQFFYLDVKPAIRARRQQPGEDVISHLLAQGRTDPEILTEAVTYGAAGMVTTREFICVAAWHMLEQPELRSHYLSATEDERHALLQEVLRLEPVVSHLMRRATQDIQLTSQGKQIVIPAGSLIDVHIATANLDEQVVGDHAKSICPARPLNASRTTSALLSFGDGSHRCPGAYIAIQETDIFLQRLLAVKGLRIVRPPTLSWGEVSLGYEFRNFQIALS